jgi:hypothetical protein
MMAHIEQLAITAADLGSRGMVHCLLSAARTAWGRGDAQEAGQCVKAAIEQIEQERKWAAEDEGNRP